MYNVYNENGELAETHIIHEYRRNECDRTYYRIHIN